MQLSQRLGQQRPCVADKSRKALQLLNVLNSPAAGSNKHRASVAGHAVGSRSVGLRTSFSRNTACVVRSVLAETPAQTVDGCPRGTHWQVHKFGGTCMASPDRLKAAAELVSRDYTE